MRIDLLIRGQGLLDSSTFVGGQVVEDAANLSPRCCKSTTLFRKPDQFLIRAHNDSVP